MKKLLAALLMALSLFGSVACADEQPEDGVIVTADDGGPKW